MKRQFIICTQDFSGLGWAKMIQETDGVFIAAQPSDKDEKLKEFNMVGKGIVPVYTMKSILAKRNTFKDAYWVFDSNKLSDISMLLRNEGFKVFGASELSAKLEHDRKFAVDLAKSSGLMIPDSQEFHDTQSGMEFLDQNEEKAYVFKPDASDLSYLTYVPNSEKDEMANRELYNYLSNLNEGTDSYILQERKKGVEINIEAWIYNGEPFFAFCGLENKRKLNRDFGENVGCAQDVAFVVDLKSDLVNETIGKMFPFYKKMKYTGFADVNVIINEKEMYFLEVCNRFGYNAHPNLFMTLAKEPLADLLADFMDGKINDFQDRFKHGFGSSISLYIDHPRTGLPIFVKEECEHSFYCYDYYSDGEQYFLAGYDNAVGIITNHDYTIEDSGEGCFNKIYLLEEVSYPDLACRSDIFKEDYPNSPIRRYKALQAMGYL